MTSTAYAQSDWRTACGVMNPLDNLECAVDHLESEININVANIATLFGITTQHTTDISNLEGDLTILQAQVNEHHFEVNVANIQGNVTSLKATVAAIPTISLTSMVDTNSVACETTDPMPTDWCPNRFLGQFRIFDAAILETSFVTMSMDNAQGLGLCHVSEINDGNFGITCNFNVPDGAELHYIVLN